MKNQTRVHLKLIHQHVPGRARFEAPQLYRASSLAAWIESQLSAWDGIRQVNASPLTATVLVLYDPKTKRLEQISKKIKSLLRTEPSKRIVSISHRQNKAWHTMNVRDVAEALVTSSQMGLSSGVAKQRLNKYGENKLPTQAGTSNWSILKNQLSTAPTLLLIGSSALSLATGGLADALVILGVVGINSAIEFLTEVSAEKRIRGLKRDSISRVWVVRNGKRKRMRARELVPGDLLILTPGTSIPADARVVQASLLQVDESTLTGESLPVLKDARSLKDRHCSLADQTSLVFRGTVVTGGSGTALIIRTGADTEVGKIEALMGKTSQPETPMQAQLRELGNQMVIFSVGASALVFLFGWLGRRPLFETLKISVSLAIAAIPESLPTIATTTLALGIRRLEEEGILTHHLEAIETLGGVDTICLDKTGTLTLNQMSVTAIRTSSREYTLVPEEGLFEGNRKIDPSTRASLIELARIVSLCNEASLKECQGSPTEIALLEFAQQVGVDHDVMNAKYPRQAIQYRAQGRSYMSTVHSLPDGRELEAIKGRPSDVLKLCNHYLDVDTIRSLDMSKRKRITHQNQEMAKQSLRVLGVAYRENGNTVWLGLVGMQDPLRPGVMRLIQKAGRAGVRTVMITGDQTDTARAIGHAVRISNGHPLVVVDSHELNFSSREKLHEQVSRAHIFSRVDPADKLKIIQALQSTGQVVAMVGDGVNDGPALKIADVGVALNSLGMEVTTQVSDMLLVHNEVEKLSFALREGRRVQDDIRRSVEYILTENAAEILFTLMCMLLGFEEPLTPMQILWINLVTDIFPELALAQEQAEPNILKRPPRHSKARILSDNEFKWMAYEAIVLTLSSLTPYLMARRKYGEAPESRTIGFLSLISSSLLFTVSARSETSSLFSRTGKNRLAPNPYIPMAMGLGFGAEFSAVLIPALQKVLGTQRINPIDLLECSLGSLVSLLLIEISKFVRFGPEAQQAA